MPSQTPIWSPSAERVRDSNLLRFIESTNVRSSTSNDISDYASLHRWSIEHNDAFWQHTWQFCKVVGKLGSQVKSFRRAKMERFKLTKYQQRYGLVLRYNP